MTDRRKSEDDRHTPRPDEGPQVHRSARSSADTTHEKSFKQQIIHLSLRNDKIGIGMIFLYFCILLIGCLLYLAEALYYDYGGERTSFDSNETLSITEEILELVLLDDKPWFIWAPQLVVAPFCWLNVFFALYSISSHSCRIAIAKTLNIPVLINFVIGLLFFITVFYPPVLKNLFIPSFFLCWPAKQAITTLIVQVLHGQQRAQRTAPNIFHAKVISLFIFLVCFIFTWVCLLHHFMRIDNRLTLFDTYWFVMVTVTTVGYGDISPSHWTTRLLVTLFIIIGVVRLVPQLEELYLAFTLQQRLNNSVGYTKTRNHIIICSTHFKRLVLMDFLTEFYSNPIHTDVHAVVLVEHELPSSLQLDLSHPVWVRRITVLIGSPLCQADLARARVQRAKACFLHTTRHETDPDTADQHTIMSAWAIKDYLNNDPRLDPDHPCRLYVQILQPENKMFLEMADRVVCEGELKNALLAASSHCPGITTLVTLLLHTFKQEELESVHPIDQELKRYSNCAPCEVLECQLSDTSKYFHQFVGNNFLNAAAVAYQNDHITLLGVQSEDGPLQLNPGCNYILKGSDTCYYIESACEKRADSEVDRPSTGCMSFRDYCAHVFGSFSLHMARDPPTQLSRTVGDYSEVLGDARIEVDTDEGKIHSEVEERPAVFGDTCTEHGSRQPQSPGSELPCCDSSIGTEEPAMELHSIGEAEELKMKDRHCHGEVTSDGGASIPPEARQQLVSDLGLKQGLLLCPSYLGFEPYYCHLLPNRSPSELKLEKPSHSLDTDGVNKACHWPQGAVIVSCSEAWEDLYHFVTPLRACNLPASRLKPLVLLLEKEPSSDFLEFIAPLPMVFYCIGSLLCVSSWLQAGILTADSVVVLSKPTVHMPDQHEHMVDAESIMAVQKLAKLFPRLHIITEVHYRYNIRYMTRETYAMKNLSRRGDHLTYLFMPQFAAGHAFCSSMLDPLLYQAHTKPFLIDLLRQLLGCKQVPGSGFLGMVEMTEELLKLQTYGHLFEHLASKEQLVPLGIYRKVTVAEISSTQDQENSSSDTQHQSQAPQQSFVLPNPPKTTGLKSNDIILVLKPTISHSQATPYNQTKTATSHSQDQPATSHNQAIKPLTSHHGNLANQPTWRTQNAWEPRIVDESQSPSTSPTRSRSMQYWNGK